MLSNRDLTEALVTNLDNWDWSVKSKFIIDETTGKALVEIYRALKTEAKKTIHQKLDELAADVCDNYCKYPQVVHEMYLRDEIKEFDQYDYLQEHHCDKCPLTEKI